MTLLGGAGQVWAIVGVIGFAAIVQFATGFGFALTSVPLLTLATAPHQAVLLALMVGILGNVGQAVEGRRLVDYTVVRWIATGALLGLPLGWLVFTRSSGTVLQVTIGAVTLLAVAALAAGLTIRAASRRTDLLTGALSGALTTTTGTNGPPIVTVLHARRIAPPVFRATTATTFLCLDIIAVLGYAATGRITQSLVLTALVTIPAIAVGALVGVQARKFLSPQAFRVVVLILLTVTGASAIAGAL